MGETSTLVERIRDPIAVENYRKVQGIMDWLDEQGLAEVRNITEEADRLRALRTFVSSADEPTPDVAGASAAGSGKGPESPTVEEGGAGAAALKEKIKEEEPPPPAPKAKHEPPPNEPQFVAQQVRQGVRTRVIRKIRRPIVRSLHDKAMRAIGSIVESQYASVKAAAVEHAEEKGK